MTGGGPGDRRTDGLVADPFNPFTGASIRRLLRPLVGSSVRGSAGPPVRRLFVRRSAGWGEGGRG
jgi:hypothetical protein